MTRRSATAPPRTGSSPQATAPPACARDRGGGGLALRPTRGGFGDTAPATARSKKRTPDGARSAGRNLAHGGAAGGRPRAEAAQFRPRPVEFRPFCRGPRGGQKGTATGRRRGAAAAVAARRSALESAAGWYQELDGLHGEPRVTVRNACGVGTVSRGQGAEESSDAIRRPTKGSSPPGSPPWPAGPGNSDGHVDELFKVRDVSGRTKNTSRVHRRCLRAGRSVYARPLPLSAPAAPRSCPTPWRCVRP